MKKLAISLLLSLFVISGYAQTKATADAVKVLTKAKADVENPKKSENPVSWVKLGTAYTGCYDAPFSGIWQGAAQAEIKLILKDQIILSSTEEEINGRVFSVDHYGDKDLYYEGGVLSAWKITKPAIQEDPLSLAFDAFDKAYELDAKQSQAKVISDSFKGLQGRYFNEAMSSYSLGDNKAASEFFEESLKASAHPSVNIVDSMVIYYTAVTAALSGDNAKAIKYLEKCAEIGYDQQGDVYASLADCYKQEKDTVKAKEVLAKGFTSYPTSQSILVALINLYMETDDDPAKLLDLLKTAQANEPDNPSLYYAEGNVHIKLGDYDKALESYKKSSDIDSSYFWGPFCVGKTYYDMAVMIQDQANNEMDDAKYEQLVKELDQSLENAIAPLEKAITLTEDKELQQYVAEVLKNIYFRFRDKSPEYKANYDKYTLFLSQQ